MMKTTVILCTYNRCQSLARTLKSVAASKIPEPVEWEVLVVDNNSSDQTREVIEDYCRRYPGHFRYLYEPQQGKSYALNSGVRAAKGGVLAFIDDDVEVDGDWLNNLTSALNNGEWAGAGGRVLPEAGFTPPRWLDTNGRYALAPLALFNLGLEAGELREAPYGANMAYRNEMFQKYGVFRTDLGRSPDGLMCNEDSEFAWRLLAAGERLKYEPLAVVYHATPRSRLQKAYFLAWWYAKSRSDIRQQGIPQDARWYIAGIPINLFRRLAVWTLKWIFNVKPRSRFSCKLNVWKVVGAIEECYRCYVAPAQVAEKSTARVTRTPLAPHK